MIHTRDDNGHPKPAPTMVTLSASSASPTAVSEAVGAPAPIEPMDLMRIAIERGADISVLERLEAMAERIDERRRQRDYDAAIAAAKALIKPIPKNREGHHGYKYADLDAIASAVDPILSQYGLSYRFESETRPNAMVMTCILSHSSGHREKNQLVGPLDTGPGRSTMQAVGSTSTYLMRYCLIQALGLAIGVAADEDDDAEGAKREIAEREIKKVTVANGNGNKSRAQWADFIRQLPSLSTEQELLDHLTAYGELMELWPEES